MSVLHGLEAKITVLHSRLVDCNSRFDSGDTGSIFLEPTQTKQDQKMTGGDRFRLSCDGVPLVQRRRRA